jgi:hypothetical protein
VSASATPAIIDLVVASDESAEVDAVDAVIRSVVVVMSVTAGGVAPRPPQPQRARRDAIG